MAIYTTFALTNKGNRNYNMERFSYEVILNSSGILCHGF